MSHGMNLSKSMCSNTDEEIETMSCIPYASVIGIIMYGIISTRPDIAYALSVAGRYQSNPGSLHWKVVKDILKYLRRTKNFFLIYGSGELELEGYTDSSLQSDVDDSKSTFGFVFKLSGGDVSWKSSKQDTTMDSTTETKYIAASAAAKEGVWMSDYIQELGVIPQTVGPVPVYCDNTEDKQQLDDLEQTEVFLSVKMQYTKAAAPQNSAATLIRQKKKRLGTAQQAPRRQTTEE
ncbi:secreted RxLR effector protein 161-like [Primulina eburnea]|uniref:secreted RxLR effector protein 161-like n=1 Tax=Primulina eburnea TaxID=1245227 RepID=UPI003C6C472E